ncbi:MAG: aminotransferase class V-fold PLP-dependent enzyme, partial [Acidobacteriaceae bacterium]|nr:aminotransferase class V-fold PLP-dependent enzyme [Acidobacteriaceae bacterium]
MPYKPGRHFLQIPGPSNVPDRVLRAIDNPTIDHRSCDASELVKHCIAQMQAVFQTKGPVIIFPASGTGGWEAALANTLSPEDTVVAFDIGHFARLWAKMAQNIGLRVDLVPGDWRSGVDVSALSRKLTGDANHDIKAVMVVHNETSTGVTSDIKSVRRVLDAARHPALLMVDTVSSLGCIDYRHDQWGVDVSISGSQKGLMLPPGLSFNALSCKAIEASRTARLSRSYWSWDAMLEKNDEGFFPYTPATNMLYGLREATAMLFEEGLQNVFARHRRHAEATRRAVSAWGLDILAKNPVEYSNTVTTVMMPAGQDEVKLRALILDTLNMSLGAGLGKLAGTVFRIGHLGDFNELMLCGTLAGVEMGLELAGVPHRNGGVAAAMTYLID